ncbi:MAG: hypothetical protein OJF60_000411 [Burkholderiaceae bacterium]|nr:MAG: hypothetical protein OJF60_000411 [Burkholderiaceae bacterium]
MNQPQAAHCVSLRPVLAARGSGPSVCPDLRRHVWSRRPQPPHRGHRQRPGRARSAAVAGLACSAAFCAFGFHAPRMARSAVNG